MDKNTNKKISDALGLEPMDHSEDDVVETPPAEAKTKLEIVRDKPLEEVIIDEDFNEARDQLRDLIQKQSDVIDQLSLVAEEGESPRHYEVLAAMLKNKMEMIDRYMNINKQRKEVTKGLPVPKGAQPILAAPTGPQTVQQIENAVFVGTTADLDKLLEARRKQKQEQANVLPTPTIQPEE